MAMIRGKTLIISENDIVIGTSQLYEHKEDGIIVYNISSTKKMGPGLLDLTIVEFDENDRETSSFVLSDLGVINVNNCKRVSCDGITFFSTDSMELEINLLI
jgi:hypothetical protein